MFGLVFFILFTPGVSGFFCTSSDLEMSYTFCDSTAHDFMFNVTPCTMLNASIWHAALTWVPKSDIAFLKVVFTVWYNGAKALHWKETVCSGADDEYYVCEMLKGGTITTTFDIKGKRTVFPKGDYSIIIEAFSDDSEKNMVMCLNYTMIVKQDSFST